MRVLLAAASAALVLWAPSAHAANLVASPWAKATDGASSVEPFGFAPSISMNVARSNGLVTYDSLNAIADDIVGASDMNVAVENDPTEWSFLTLSPDAQDILGFVRLFSPPSYHQIFLGPQTYPAWQAWFASGSPAGNESDFAVAAFTLIHESFHWRLVSTDENTVNACALSWFGYYLNRDFNVPATVTQTSTESVPQTTVKRVAVKKMVKTSRWVRVGGKLVRRTVTKPVTTYVNKTVTTYVDQTVTTTVPNPVYTTLVSDAQAFYAGQPSNYNTGSCSISPPAGTTPPPAPAPTPSPPRSGNYHVEQCWQQYTAGSWSSVDETDATTSFSGNDIAKKGAANYWAIVELDQPPIVSFDGTTLTLIEPNGSTFGTATLPQPWSIFTRRAAIQFTWTWSGDGSLFFQHPESSGDGQWTFRWTFPDGQTCSSSFSVS